jgi:hypothetical protein
MDSQNPQQLAITAPTLPKGGGAIQSVGKGWGPVGTTGAASLELALPITAGRGYAPGLTLVYQSSVGNGLFGLGWNINLGCVARRATKGVPTYTDDDVILGPDGDVWLAERNTDGTVKFTITPAPDKRSYQVIRHFARREGAFDLIEHWRLDDIDPGFWLVHGADGSLAFYGKNAGSRSTDPADSNHVAEWLLEETMNAYGEHVLYEYKSEDQLGLPEDHPRDFIAQCYLWRVRYGNFTQGPQLYLWTPEALPDLQWHFDLLFDYGERTDKHNEIPAYEEQQVWPVRSDAHSSFSYGFEFGNLRLCRQVLMFHCFPEELGETPVLINRLLLEYKELGLGYNVLSVAHSQAVNAQGMLETRPPLYLEFREFDVSVGAFTEFDALPGLNDGQQYQMVDLFADGLPGVLYRDDKVWLYREPLRAEAGAADAVAYGPWQALPQMPTADSGKPVQQSLIDLNGDGRLDWLVAQPGMAGFFTLNPDRSWSGFVPFSAFAPEFFHPQGQLADLVGAGLSDLALIGPRSVRLYANQRAEGFAPGVDVTHDEEDDRLPLLSDSRTELVAFSDILGTGQQHLVRIRHNEIRFWPNLGRGLFGKGQLFASLPFDYAKFDAGRIRLADMDGSGATDMLYLETDGFQIFMNRCGNGLDEPYTQAWPEGVRYDRFSQVSLADLNGLGFSSLVLTVPHMKPRHWRFDYPAVKPYLLQGTDNNMGAVGSVTYRSSAQEWLDEKQSLQAAGRPAESRLPFPLHVVVQQTQLDEITGNRLTQQIQYRLGYYDNREREFRGFGLVLQTDTEQAGVQKEEEGFTAPILSKTWFHTGRYPEPDREDYNTSDPLAVALGAHLLTSFNDQTGADEIIPDADTDALQEMARALSGMVLRTETFGLDGDKAEAVPYSLQISRYLVRQLRPLSAHQPYAAMLVLAAENIAYQYERQADDPRCEHSLNLSWDAYGSLTHSVTVNYARRATAKNPFDEEHLQTWWQASHDEAQTFFYLTEIRAQAIHLDKSDSWHLGLPYRQRTNAMVVPATDLSPADISYEQFTAADGKFALLARTLTGLSVQRYIGCDDGEASFEALPDATESAELDAHALSAYERVMNEEQLAAKLLEVGYQRMQAFFPDEALTLWSVKRSFATYAPAQGFYRIQTFRPTASHGWSSVEHDPYHLMLTSMTDPSGCTTRATYDYRTLQPVTIIDPNQNTQQALYDGFGQLRATTFFGTELGEPIGFDSIDQYPDFSGKPYEVVQAPSLALGKMASVFYYDLFSWMETRHEPVHSVVLLADRYPDDEQRQIRMTLQSLDGFGRTLQTRQRVEDGKAYSVDPDGNLKLEYGTQEPEIVDAAPRWRVSERVEYNNKGLPVRVYRPYFANNHVYVTDKAMREHGYHDKQRYDPLGRPITTTTAKGWMRRQSYLTWYTVSEDENDTAEEVLAARKIGSRSDE